MTDIDRKRLLSLWAKTNQNQTNSASYHPLICHLLDVAAVAEVVWDECLDQAGRQRIETAFGTEALRKVAFLCGAHDVGKASPGFQNKVPELAHTCEFQFSRDDQSPPHGFVSAHVLKDKKTGYPCPKVLAMIAGGHHGRFPRSEDLLLGANTLGNADWRDARQALLRNLATILGWVQTEPPQWGEVDDPAVVPILAGFLSVVDWIGSNQRYFPCREANELTTEDALQDYWTYAQKQTRKALEELGWLPGVAFATEEPFGTVFGGFAPNPAQSIAIEMAEKQTSPYLMIIEAAMGQGKTEAALYAADLAMCRGFARGMYVAMPTQATSNAMFERVLYDYLQKRGHQGRLNVQLVHGDALLAATMAKAGEVNEFKPANIEDETGKGEDEADLDAQSWFTTKKRPLLAPFGVGTIDQSLMSVLQTKHWFVRLFGLAGKVVIFDEVHAYDAYMSTLLERLLRWLAEIDCTVILLSATLPEVKRKALIKAYSGRDDSPSERYPRITMAQPRHYPNSLVSNRPKCERIPLDTPRQVNLRTITNDLNGLNQDLRQRLAHGGCAAVICNTVGRSIEVFRHLEENLADTECLLFHARTLRMWRREREAEVLAKFGKGEKQSDGSYRNANRPRRAVLVATQVIEQSLDLDFDLMYSEMAPVDLLLQRCGRMHRHKRERPPRLKCPTFVVMCDADKTGPPPKSFGKGNEAVYDRYVLLHTWLTLRGLPQIALPGQIEELVERVYGDPQQTQDAEWETALREASEKEIHERQESEKAAKKLLVGDPKSPDDLIEEFNGQLADDEDPQANADVRAATREGEPSITVVLLPETIVLTADPDVDQARELLDRSAKLSGRYLSKEILTWGECPPEWRKNAHLRYARLVRLDEQNGGSVGKYRIEINKKEGVLIKKEGEHNG